MDLLNSPDIQIPLSIGNQEAPPPPQAVAQGFLKVMDIT